MSVAVPVPALGLLTYRVARPTVPCRCAGARVVVPLGKRTLTGVVLGVDRRSSTPRSRCATSCDVLDAEPFVPADVVKLTPWVADYYLAGPGAALASALPPHALTARVDRFKTVRVAALTAAGLDWPSACAPQCLRG